MDNKYLRKIQKLLKNYFCYFKHPNILVVSEDKAVLPFAYLIIDENYPGKLLLSVAVDYPTSLNVAEIALISNNILPVMLSDVFYISSTNGNTYFNEDAYNRWDGETIDLNLLTPISNVQN